MKQIQEIETKKLLHFEGNPRFETEVQEGLLQDVKKNGVLIPLLVSPAKNGQYDVIDGERRRICAVELKIPKLMCIIEEMDETTKWQRAYDLNALNKPFSPMEQAKNFYRRKKRFFLTDEKLSLSSSSSISERHVSTLISLNKLPDEIQLMVHEKILGVRAAYEISRLAFDIGFPQIGKSKSVKDWDFDYSKEPKKWTEKRKRMQFDLAKRFIEKRVPVQNREALINEINKQIKLEEERREKEAKAQQELEEELLELHENLSPLLETYTESLIADLEEIIPDENERKQSKLNEYLLDSKSIQQFFYENKKQEPKKFYDFIHDLQEEMNKQRPDENQMNILRAANSNLVSFNRSFKRKDPLIFKIIPDEEKSDFEKDKIIYKPHCTHCGSEVDQERMERFNNIIVDSFDKLEAKEKKVLKARQRATKSLVQIQSKFIDRINIAKEELDELKEKMEED